VVRVDLDAHLDADHPVAADALAHSRPSRSAAVCTARLCASEAALISPRPHVHTPTGTEVTETPNTSSTGSHPIECNSSASSI
jgi:hypothetical protein